MKSNILCNRKLLTYIITVIYASMMCIILTGCGNTTIDGTWVEVKQVDSDGAVRTAADLPFEETFVISGDTATHTVHTKDGSIDDITVSYNVKKISDTQYSLSFGESYEFAMLTIKGKQFSFRANNGFDEETLAMLKEMNADTSEYENLPEYTDYYFEKK